MNKLHVAVALSAMGALAGACADQSATPARVSGPATPSAQARFDDQSSPRPTVSVRWNALARSLVASHNTNAPMASRVYALVSVAQFEAASAAKNDKGRRDTDPGRGDTGAVVDAAIVRASANVLSGLYIDAASAETIAAELAMDDPHGAANPGGAIGAQVAQAVLTRAAADNSVNANCPATPPLPASQFWHDDAVPPNPQPLLPCFGRVRTWLGIDVTQFRAGPPPVFGSPAYLAGLAEVRLISDTRTAAQLAIVDTWLDGANTQTPPGHWNLIASDLATKNRLSPADAARVFAVLNITMMDTHIACWDRKYTYWEARPWMVDPLITTPRGQPHHPANPSGHACAGGAGSGALAGLFPAEAGSLLAQGDEQGFSTVLSGVHFRFDVDAGLRIGRTIAVKTLAVRDLNAFLLSTQLPQ